MQTFTAGCNGYYKFETWGAKGGDRYISGGVGGKGAYASGTINLSKNQSFKVYVGGAGQKGTSSAVTSSRWGGWNGGGGKRGNSGNSNDYYSNECNWYPGTGGGATDIRTTESSIVSDSNHYAYTTSDQSLRSRIMVAAGGGGAGTGSSYTTVSSGVDGSYGGGLNGGVYGVWYNYVAQTACSQTAGGIGNTGGCGYYASYQDGVFGVGGAGGHCTWGGGGGGWYGGASGSCHSGPGAGGSSYISGHLGSVAVTSLSITSPKCSSGTTIACSQSPTGYTFVDGTTQMIAGNASMPNPRGSGNITGNNGNGYARITYLGTSI